MPSRQRVRADGAKVEGQSGEGKLGEEVGDEKVITTAGRAPAISCPLEKSTTKDGGWLGGR